MRTDTAARRRFIRGLISGAQVRNQEAIREALIDEGYDVTQATISRDLTAIGAARVRDDGHTVYRLVTSEGTDADLEALHEAVDEFVESLTTSANLLVLKVPPGAAQFVASRIDAASIAGVLGSIAGDDTILVVTADDHDPRELARHIEGTE